MIQFYTTLSDRYSIVEEVKLAVDGGCHWINLCADGMSRECLKEAAEEIVPVCREKDVFLIIDNDVELVHELKVHGVRLADGSLSAKETRDRLGPHAIIGVAVSSASEAAALRGVDVDYVTADISILKEVAVAVSAFQLPVVAAGDVTAENMQSLLEDGAQGLGFSASVVNAADPSAYIAGIMTKV